MKLCQWPSTLGALATLLALAVLAAWSDQGPSATEGARRPFDYPMVPPHHGHMRQLLDNAFGYLDPSHGIVDPRSGYPTEGWNQDPQNGLFLRSFTQLTAVGMWVELLANIAAGLAENPHISKESALDRLSLAVASLLEDQKNPDLAAKGLLANFVTLEGPSRTGPLVETVERRQFIEAFGEHEAGAIWQALVQKGWLEEEDAGRKARVRRGEGYGASHFDGPLAAWSQPPVVAEIMRLLDRRSVTIVFGDNANLTAALGRSIGALLRPGVRDQPRATELRGRMERFIEAQREGYAHLYDADSANFVFGWDAVADRNMGWDDGQGHWVTGRMNYLINEFRGPWTFVVLRYGLPVDALRNAGLKIKPYRGADGLDTYALAAWDGSAFQFLGLSLFMQELQSPGWRLNLERLVDIELDYSNRGGLPGLLSEAYSGRGTQYTGHIGIPELAVSTEPLDTRSPSLYTLGVAYEIAPDKVEGFLAGHWAAISGLFTDHGPWEGWNLDTRSPIRFQTTAHTLALILGGIGSAQGNMRLYLEERDLLDPLEALYRPGNRLDLLSGEARILPWSSDGAPVEVDCDHGECALRARLTGTGGISFAMPEGRTMSLSNGRLSMRYRNVEPVDASMVFRRAKDDPLPPPSIPVEVLPHFERTEDGAIEILLPPTPALSGIAEIALTLHGGQGSEPVELTLRELQFVPFEGASAR